MHFLDIMILCCIIGWAALGFFAGLLAQLSLLLSLIVGFACNWFMGNWIREQMQLWFEQEWINWLAAYIISFLLALMIIKILAAILKNVLGGEESKNLDRTLGAIFGTLKGILLAMFLVICLDLFAKPETFDNTTVTPYIRGGAVWLADSLIDRDKLAQIAEDISQRIKQDKHIQGFEQGKKLLEKIKNASEDIPNTPAVEHLADENTENE